MSLGQGSQAGMQMLTVVPNFDVLEDGDAGLGTFGLEDAKEAFHSKQTDTFTFWFSRYDL
jgi:hypothetical protein